MNTYFWESIKYLLLAHIFIDIEVFIESYIYSISVSSYPVYMYKLIFIDFSGTFMVFISSPNVSD